MNQKRFILTGIGAVVIAMGIWLFLRERLFLSRAALQEEMVRLLVVNREAITEGKPQSAWKVEGTRSLSQSPDGRIIDCWGNVIAVSTKLVSPSTLRLDASNQDFSSKRGPVVAQIDIELEEGKGK